eukprot:6214277-Pleurochrysis_carterae.AAC.1
MVFGRECAAALKRRFSPRTQCRLQNLEKRERRPAGDSVRAREDSFCVRVLVAMHSRRQTKWATYEKPGRRLCVGAQRASSAGAVVQRDGRRRRLRRFTEVQITQGTKCSL